MTDAAPRNCPMHDNVDRRKSAKMAIANTRPDDNAHWVKNPLLGRKILRNKQSFQAGAGADLVSFKNPEHAPVFFLDGDDHANKRRKTQRFLSPKAISDQHFEIMTRITDELLTDFKQKGSGKLEDIGFKLAIEVVGEILGLTESDEASRPARVQRVLQASIAAAGDSALARFTLNIKRAVAIGVFYWFDVRPAIKARKKSPKNDAISFFIDEGYPGFIITIECLTYGTAGMLTTREFITMVAWYLFEDAALRERYLKGDMKEQMAILMEILRLEPVAAMIHRRVNEEVEGLGDTPLPAGEKYGIDIRASNVHEDLAGECPFALDPDRAKRQKDAGRYMSFGDGPHSCPGWQVALQETRIFIEQLMKIPGVKLEREPDMFWNDQLKSYELRNADISCDIAN